MTEEERLELERLQERHVGALPCRFASMIQ